MTVSVVLASHNEGEQLRRTVSSLLATLPRGGEIVVVDDRSTDGSADFIDETYPCVRVVTAPERLGIARARNLGAANSKGDVLVFGDAHIEATFGWVEGLLPLLRRESVGIAIPTVTVMGNPAAKGYGYTLADLSLNMRWLSWQGAEPHPVPLGCGCFMAMRRNVFDAVGGFDDGFRGWGAEDSELSLRLWLLGYECVLAPEVEVAHLFQDRFPYHVDMGTLLRNNLRMAITHFDEEMLECVFARLAGQAAFPAALAHALSGDVFERRQRLSSRRKRDARWFFDRFEIPVN